MRKTLGIAIGGVLLCGVVMTVLLAMPPSNNDPIIIVINGDFQTDGVDQPWFVLSKGANEKVQWKNESGVPCTISYGKHGPFDVEPIDVPDGQQTGEFAPAKAPHAPPPAKLPPNGIYKVYKYTLNCGGTEFDPGNGVRP
jgi:hypothetical protein